MIDRASAKAMVSRYMGANFDGEDLVIVDCEQFETAHAWVFFYNSRRYLETGDISAALAGNGPILVNKTTGNIEAFGAAIPLDKLFAEYEKKQDKLRVTPRA